MQPQRRQQQQQDSRRPATVAQACSRQSPINIPVPRDGIAPTGFAGCPSGLSTLRGIADLLNSTLAQCHRNGERIAAHAGRSALWETDRILHMLVGKIMFNNP